MEMLGFLREMRILSASVSCSTPTWKTEMMT